MAEAFQIQFFTNMIASTKATDQIPEMRLFLDTMQLMDLVPEFRYVQKTSRSNIATIGNRADKNIGTVMQIIRMSKRHNGGILHLQINSNADQTFAAILVEQLLADGYQVYISGLSPLEQKKIISKIDYTFKAIPPELNQDDVNQILANFHKTHFIEMFEQSLLSQPILEGQIKNETIKLAKQKNKDLRNPLVASRLVNFLLINEHWQRYDKLLQILFLNLWQKEDVDGAQQARLLMSLIMQDPAGIIKQIASIATIDQKETLQKLKQKNDLINYISILPNINATDNFKSHVRDIVSRSLFIDRLKRDSQAYKGVFFVTPDDNESSRVKLDLLDFTKKFTKELKKETIENNATQISKELKKIYTAEIIRMMMLAAHPQFISSLYNRDYFKKKLQDILEMDIFSVDRVIINPLIQSSNSPHYILGRVLSQIQISYYQASLLIEALMNYINPYYKNFNYLKESLLEIMHSKKTEVSEKEYDEFVSRSINVLPKMDFLLHANESRLVEKALFLGAKKALGMEVFKNDFQLKSEDLKIGYTQINVTAIHETKQINFDPQWLYDTYDFFIEQAALKKASEILKINIEYIRSGKVFAYDFIWQSLKEDGVYLGYHQLAKLLARSKYWSYETLTANGYQPTAIVEYDCVDLIFDPALWGNLIKNTKEVNFPTFTDTANKKAKSTTPEPIQYPIKIIMDKNLHRYVSAAQDRWQKNLDTLLDIKRDNEFVYWVSEFTKNLISNQIYNIYAEEAAALFPANRNILALNIFIQDFFRNNFQGLKSLPNIFVIQYDSASSFIPFFVRHLSIELNNSLIPLVFVECHYNTMPSDENNWLWGKLVNELRETKARIYTNLINVWRELQNYHKEYLNLTHALGLMLIADIIQRYIKPQDKGQIETVYFKKIDDQFKLAVCSGRLEEADAVLIRRQVGLNVISHTDMYEKIFNFNQAEQDKRKINHILTMINNFLSAIPYIKYAPKLHKKFRNNLKQIEGFMKQKISEMDAGNIRDITTIAADTWQIYSDLIKTEAGYVFKYRYLTIAFNNLKLRVDSSYERVFIDFVRSAAEELAGRKAARDYILIRMIEGINFKNMIAEKSLFYIFGAQSKIEELTYILEGIRSMKGIDADIFIDSKGTEEIRNKLLTYTGPNNITNLRR